MFSSKQGVRQGILVAACLAAVAVISPAAASGQEYGSDQQAMQSYSNSCGHLGGSCEEPKSSKKAKTKSSCSRSAKSRRGKRSRVSVRAYAAPRALRGSNSQKRSRKASCAKRRS